MPALTGRTELLAPDIGQHLAAEQQAAAAFERAAKTILKRLPDAMAYAGADEPQITGHILTPDDHLRMAEYTRPPGWTLADEIHWLGRSAIYCLLLGTL